jgi:hypothetical protein
LSARQVTAGTWPSLQYCCRSQPLQHRWGDFECYGDVSSVTNSRSERIEKFPRIKDTLLTMEIASPSIECRNLRLSVLSVSVRLSGVPSLQIGKQCRYFFLLQYHGAGSCPILVRSSNIHFVLSCTQHMCMNGVFCARRYSSTSLRLIPARNFSE